MDREFYTDEFEQFLKSKADQHRLYPSEIVWKKIYNTLHPTKGRIIVAAMFLLFLFVGDQVILLRPNKNEIPESQISNNEIVVNNFLQQIRAGLNLTQSKATVHIYNQPIYSTNLNTYKWLNNTRANIALPKAIAEKLQQGKQNITADYKHAENKSVAYLHTISPADENAVTYFSDDNSNQPEGTNISLTKTATVSLLNNADNKPSIAANVITAENNNQSSIQHPSFAKTVLTKSKEKNTLRLQYYFSPSISFRKLEQDSKPVSTPNLPLASNDINRFVNHSPTIGIEAGSALLLPVTKNISIKAGLQLNVNGYNVNAFTYSREKATISLNTPPGIRDSINAFTSIRNLNGYTQELLQNRYFQISMPVGIDMKIIGDHRLQLNAAATIQPLYVMAHRTYLLSNDYNNYVQEKSLVRKWNYAAALETYISYTSDNGLKWQVGPQLRYQLKSTYSDRYPIKEYLMEYSIKFSVMKTLK